MNEQGGPNILSALGITNPVSLVTNLFGFGMSMSAANAQRAAEARATKAAEIAVADARKQIKKAGFSALAVPMEAFQQRERQIQQDVTQAVEAAREAGPRGVAGVSGIVEAADVAAEKDQAAKEKAMFQLEAQKEAQMDKSLLGLANLDIAEAQGAQQAAAEARKAASALDTTAFTSLGKAISSQTEFDPNAPAYKGEAKPFAETGVGKFFGKAGDWLSGLFGGNKTAQVDFEALNQKAYDAFGSGAVVPSKYGNI